MKKTFYFILISLALSLPLVNQVFASQFGQGLANTAQESGFTDVSVEQYAAIIIQAVLGLVGIIFVALLIYGGFLYMTSQGEPDKVKKGKNAIIAAVIGIIIIVSGYSITYFIVTQVETPGGKPAFNPKCENAGSLDYNSCECCQYRKSGSASCCSQSCCSGDLCGCK
ncbi:MAG: hypothetical protein PHC97_00640 [Patescibacteria group bacterium]|nr:hypothetical protein [Patescibacteria group bacterium]